MIGLGHTTSAAHPGRHRLGASRITPNRRVHPTLGAILAALFALTAFSLGTRPAWAQPSGSSRTPTAVTPARLSSAQSDFVAEVDRTLKSERERILEITNQVFGTGSDRERQLNELVNQEIRTKSTASNYENAKLTREVEEIGIIEYTDGIFIQDQQTAEGELILAKGDLDRQRDNPEIFKQQLARVEAASRGSVWDLSVEFGLHDAIAESYRRAREAERTAAKAERKVKMIGEAFKAMRTLELRAKVEDARANELALRAQLEDDTAKEKRLAAALGIHDRSQSGGRSMRTSAMRLRLSGSRSLAPDAVADQKPVLAVLEQATSIDEQIRRKLDQVAADGKLDSVRQEEIRKLVRQFQAIVNQAHSECSALQLARLKPRIHREATPMSPDRK